MLIAYSAQLLAIIVIVFTLWGKLQRDEWWVRGCDFPRLQVVVVGTFAWLVLCYLAYIQQWSTGFLTHQMVYYGIFGLLTACISFQLYMIIPYSIFYKKQVKNTKKIELNQQISLLVANVLTPNKNTQALIDLVNQYRPDVLLTLESDMRWQKHLTVLEKNYPYSVKVPLDNLYGMHLYSRLELVSPEVKYLVLDDIPSIHTQIKLRSGDLIKLYCLHPMPPSPTEADKSTTRDAEILMVGREIKQLDQPAILAGDLNDVAWSRTTRLFQRISGLLDPRIGRKFINSFHAQLPFLRWALDHVFHSRCFTYVDMRRLPDIGSDHFPVYTLLQYQPERKHEHNIPVASEEDKHWAKTKVDAGFIEAKRIYQKQLTKNATLTDLKR